MTPCIQVSTDGGTTWTRTGFTAAVYNGDGVKVTKTSGSWAAGLKGQVLKGESFGWGLKTLPPISDPGYAAAVTLLASQVLECNTACTDKMLYEEMDILTDAPGLCVQPSQTMHTLAGA